MKKEKEIIQEVVEEKKKQSVKAQRCFPQHSMEEALAVAETIAKNNAGNPWTCEQIASSLEVSVKSTNFYYLTASSRDYGFTTGTSRSKLIELTALGRKLVYPENSGQEAEALGLAFENIDIFKRVFEYYKGGVLPEKKYLFNTLQETFHLHQDYHEEFYNIYLKNTQSLSRKQQTNTSYVIKESIERISQIETDISQKDLFVIMPFSEKTDKYPQGYFDEVYNSLIVPAAAAAGFTAKTANKTGSDIIHKTIVNNIYHAELILADLTEHNPNVLFELGLAIAFKKKVAIIRAKGTKAIFDVDNSMRVLDYNPNLWKSTLDMDVEKLSNHILATLEDTDECYLDIFLTQ